MKHKEVLLVIILILVGMLFSLYGFRSSKPVPIVPTRTTYIWKTKTPTLTPSKTSTPMPDTPTPYPTNTPTSTAVSVRDFSDDWEHVFNLRSNCVDFDELGGIWSIYSDENDKVTVQRYFEDVWQPIDVPEEIVLNKTCPHVLKHNDVWFYGYWVESSGFVYRYYQGKWLAVQVPGTDKREEESYSSLHLDSYGRFWMGHDECDRWHTCLFLYENGFWHDVNFPFRQVQSIKSDEEGNVWVEGNFAEGLAVYKKGKWEYIDRSEIWDYPTSEWDRYVNRNIPIFGINSDEIIITDGGNPLIIVSSTGDFIRLKNPIFWSQIFQMTIYEDRDQRIWFTFNGDLFGYYDQRTQQWVKYQNTPADNYFFEGTNIFKNRNTGEVWFLLVKWAGDEKGLYRLKENIQ